MTHWWKVASDSGLNELVTNEQIIQAAKLLKEGGLVAFPTETVYGLGADATSEKAVSAIFTAKGRPSDNPLIIHIGKKEQLSEWVEELPEVAQLLVDHFWPGPLTLVLPHKHNLASNVTAGLSTVAVRMPDHPVAVALLQKADLPVAAPSANLSGRPSPTDANHVWKDLTGRIDVLLDGGPTGVGIESTVVDVTGHQLVLLRPGGISIEELEQVAGKIEIDQGLLGEQTVPRSPGMKYRHYAPKGEMWLIQGEQHKVHERMRNIARDAMREGRRVGILTTEEFIDQFQVDVVIACGRRSEPASVARQLYHSLRKFDDSQVNLILAETFPARGIFYSVMNRLRKAADGKVIRV